MSNHPPVRLELPPLDVATVAWLVDVCGRLAHALLRRYGDELEAYWAVTEPEQPITGPLRSPRPPRAR